MVLQSVSNGDDSERTNRVQLINGKCNFLEKEKNNNGYELKWDVSSAQEIDRRTLKEINFKAFIRFDIY